MKGDCKFLGFTIFEILLVLSIGGMVMFFALPWGSELMEKNRAFYYANVVGDAIAFARASSIVHGQRIFFCHNITGTTCGVIKNNSPGIVTESGQILRLLPPLPRGDKFCFKMSGRKKNQHLTFMPHGLLDGHNGSFFYCPRGRSNHALAIIFNRSGRIRTDTVTAQRNKIRCDCPTYF